jgi:uncharacterized protein (TIGR03083 family)
LGVAVDRDEVWEAIGAGRLAAADLLAGLSAEEWERPSLCAGWRIRDVAAHLTLAPQTGLGTALVELVRARGSFDRMIHDTARRKATLPVERLVDEIRMIAGSHRLAPGTTQLDPLLDVLVHTQDIAVPLGRHLPVPPEAGRAAAERVWSMGWPFHARRRLAGRQLVATDTAWEAGDGPPVEGPMDAMLLLLTGRPIAHGRLTGELPPMIMRTL